MGLGFDGIDDQVLVADQMDELDVGAREFSFEAWVQLADCVGRHPILTRAGAFELYCTDGAAGMQVGGVSFGGGAPITAGRWHHVVGVRAVDSLRLYVDGAMGVVPTNPTVLAPSDRPILFGSDGADFFEGVIDEVRLWSCRLDDDDVRDLRFRFQPGMVAHWPLDGDARGAAGMGFDGTIVGGGVDFFSGRVGQGARFDGSGSRIEMDLPEWFADDYTAEAWFQSTSTGGQQIIVNRESRPRGPIHLWVSDTRLNTNIRDAMSAGSGAFIDGTYTDGTWHHAAVVRRGADGGPVETDLYLDGMLVDQGMNTLGVTSVTDALFTIGYRLPSDPRPFDGVIDEVKIYDRALAAPEIMGAYQATRPVGGGG